MEWVRPIPKAGERSWHASGPSFSPKGRFWTRFGSFLMIWARTDILGGTWTSRTRPRTGREALAWPILFCLIAQKKEPDIFYFRRGVSYPPPSRNKPDFFLFGGGQIQDRHSWFPPPNKQKVRPFLAGQATASSPAESKKTCFFVFA